MPDLPRCRPDGRGRACGTDVTPRSVAPTVPGSDGDTTTVDSTDPAPRPPPRPGIAPPLGPHLPRDPHRFGSDRHHPAGLDALTQPEPTLRSEWSVTVQDSLLG